MCIITSIVQTKEKEKRGAQMKNTNEPKHQHTHTAAGTDIEAVKRENEQSGMSYNEAKEFLARTTGGHGTSVLYSDTDIESVKRKNQTKQN